MANENLIKQLESLTPKLDGGDLLVLARAIGKIQEQDFVIQYFDDALTQTWHSASKYDLIVDYINGENTTHGNCKVHAYIRDREADVGRLNSKVQNLESELKEYLCEYFFDVSDLRDDGWWVTNATTSSVQAGDRLVELGVLEKDPNRGTGRVQFYRVIES